MEEVSQLGTFFLPTTAEPQPSTRSITAMAATTTGSASSSMTSTSHTMTFLPAPNKSRGTNGDSNGTLHSILRAALEPANQHIFVQPSKDVCEAAIDEAKNVLDRVAGAVVDEQAARKTGSKRKRGDANGEELRLRKLHTAGFEVEQVWEQARRVIDALRGEVIKGLEELGANNGYERYPTDTPQGLVKTVRFDEDGFEAESDGESLLSEGEISHSGSDMEMTNDGDISREDMNEYEDEEDVIDEVETDMDMDVLLNDIEGDDNDWNDETAPEVFIEDPNKLNDGFFSIDEFNKQTEFLEQQDAAADPYTGEASDEEEIDWDTNPMSMPAPLASSSRRAAAMDVQDDESGIEDSDDDDGPTFGNADLNAPEGDSDDGKGDDMDEDANGAGNNTNEILYKDFFEPPPRKAGKGERQAQFLDRQARKPKPQISTNDEAEMERAIANVRRDLFDDNSVNDGSDDPLSDVDASEPKSRKSAHERRQNKMAEEIRRLEAASVAKREWTLAGEARAADRPVNSLLEEDLDFERTGKPVPVITAEVSESIEELIKRRIIAQEFDEVTRRRPDSDSVPSNTRRGAFELDDNKPKQSLAELYEEDHVKSNNPDTYISKADEKLQRQHQEIDHLWKEVSAKLDALSSWHYKPKPPAPSLIVVADVATIAMEDAQPTTAGGVAGGESMLAPQEIYKAGKEKTTIEKGEVVPKSGVPVARQEMTREEKLRRRRREKERIKKRGGVELNGKPEGKKAKEKRETVDELKRAGVKVIGKRGDVRDVDGNKLKAALVTNGAGGFKL